MPRPPESPDVRASKTLAYILRHGAEKEGLAIRSDGFVKLNDVMKRPKMRDVDLATVLRLVEENAKKRFELVWGYDPSPPRPKKKPVQGLSKKDKARMRAEAEAKAAGQVDDQAIGIGKGDGSPHVPLEGAKKAAGEGAGMDAAALDDLQHDLSKASIRPGPQATSSKTDSKPEEKIVELSLVLLDPPATSSAEDDLESSLGPADPFAASGTSAASAELPGAGRTRAAKEPKGEYFIRASQGHSIALESTAHLTPVGDDDAGRDAVGEMVHGTKWELWDVLKNEGLSRMTRQHIHLAPSFSGPITPRPNATLYIHLSLPALLKAGIPVYVSNNGVVLTPGNEAGVVKKEYWSCAWRKEKGKKVVVCEEGKEVERVLGDDEGFDAVRTGEDRTGEERGR